MMMMFSFNTVAQTYDVVIYDDANSLGNLVVSSNGNMYLLWENTTGDDTIFCSYSTNDGDTWTTVNTSLVFVNDTESFEGCAIDSNNIVHIVTSERVGTSLLHFRYYQFNPSNLTCYGKYEFEHRTFNTAVQPDACITVDSGNNVYIFYAESKTDDPENSAVKMIIRNNGGSWSGEQSAFSESTTQSSDINGLSADTDSNGDVYCSFILEEGVASYDNELYCIKWDADAMTFSEVQPLGETIQDYQSWSNENSITDLVVDTNDVIHIVYQTEDASDDAFIKYCYSNDYSTWYNETVFYYNGYDNEDPSISYSADGELHILWTGRDVIYNDRHITMGISGTFGNWETRGYYAVDNSDSMVGTTQCYQNYPSFTGLNSGMIGCTLNNTDSKSLFLDEGTFTFYGESNVTTDTEWESCTSGALQVFKMFDNSTIQFNDTANFKVYKANTYWAKCYIYNDDTDEIVKEYSASTIPVRYVDWNSAYDYDDISGSSNFSFRVSYAPYDDWDIICDFTISGNTVSPYASDDWFIQISTYGNTDQMIIYYEIPDAYNGDISIGWGTNMNFSWFPLKTGETCSGSTGCEYLTPFWIDRDYYTVYGVRLVNGSDSTDVYYSYLYIGDEDTFDYDIWVNDQRFGNVVVGIGEDVYIDTVVTSLDLDPRIVVLTDLTDLSTIEQEYDIKTLYDEFIFTPDTIDTYYVLLTLDGELLGDGLYCNIVCVDFVVNNTIYLRDNTILLGESFNFYGSVSYPDRSYVNVNYETIPYVTFDITETPYSEFFKPSNTGNYTFYLYVDGVNVGNVTGTVSASDIIGDGAVTWVGLPLIVWYGFVAMIIIGFAIVLPTALTKIFHPILNGSFGVMGICVCILLGLLPLLFLYVLILSIIAIVVIKILRG